ncbi:MAG: E3 binding domain-containing protein [Actinomycetia bacterium]|nr:E3 binding domain-containing protein [Actinomycetes bacterium]
MIEKVVMPQLGESVTEGTIGQWLKKPGDRVEKYESLLEVLTDKVNAEVPAPAEGTLVRILVEEGQTVPVGTPIAELEVAGGEPAPAPAAAAPEPAPAAPAPAEAPAAAPAAPRGGPRYSPAVRRLAAEHRIDPGTIPGTGAGGRVTRRDVEAYLAARREAPAPAPAAPPPPRLV